jgi:type VI secretion system secreted protein Hcp
MTKKLLAVLALPAVVSAAAGSALAAGESSAVPQRPATTTIENNVGGELLTTGQSEAFVKIDGIAGESDDPQHFGEVDVKSFAIDAKNTPSTSGGGGGAGKVAFGNARFAKLYDASSPKLLLRTATGQHIPTVTFTFRKPDAPRTFLTYKLTDVTVVDYEQGGDKDRATLEHVD